MDDTFQTVDMPLSQSAKPQQNVQDRFLSMLCREQVPVYIYLVNGIKLQGYIKSFDQYVIYLNDPVAQIVYKRSICSVMQQMHGAKPPERIDRGMDRPDRDTDK